MSTIRVVNLQHTDATEPNIVLEADGTAVFASGITISGGTNLTVSGTAEFASGTVSAPGITFIDDNNTGIYEPAADTVAITTAATEHLRVDSSGRVGVGTSSPSNKLHVEANNSSVDLVYFNNTGVTASDVLRLNTTGTGSGTNIFDAQAGGTSRFLVRGDGNVGINTTSPSNLLDVASAVGDGIRIGASPAGTITRESEGLRITGVSTNKNISFVTAGSEACRIDTSGNLLINKTSTGSIAVNAPLQVKSGSSAWGINLSCRSNNDYAYFAFTSHDSNEALANIFTQRTGTSQAYLAFATNNGSTSATERMRIDSSGNVGIGTTSPARKLNLVSTGEVYQKFSNNSTGSSATDGFDIGIGSGNTAYIWNYEADSTVFGTNGSERMRIDSSGRLLVGTSSSRSVLSTNAPGLLQVEVNGSTAWPATFMANRSDQYGPILGLCKSRGTTSGSQTTVQSGDTLGSILFGGTDGSNEISGAKINAEVDGTPGTNDMPGRLVFSTTADGASSPTERMRISSDGLVNITNGRLYMQASTGSPLCFVYNTNNTSTDTSYRSDLGVNANGTSAYHFYAETGGSGKFAIYGNGTYGTISDQRLKTHIEPARTGYLDDLNRLNIVKYGWKTDELDHATELGVIAQDVETVFPGLIQDTPPNENGETFKGVKTSVFTFMLIKALQEASAKIETLEAKVAALESA